MEWKSWPCLPLTQRQDLPTQPGIYVVVDAEDQVWYVGRSVNLNARWNAGVHHRYKQFKRTNSKRLYKIYWKSFSINQLPEKEQLYIDRFKPHLNYSRVQTYTRRAIHPDQEISRLLRVINKNTMLFRDLRSVVAGFYREIDEDEEGLLKEFCCIVIIVNVHDHDKVILNSYTKSFSKKGSHLKGYWYTYKSDCGSDNPDLKPALIPAFVLGNIVFEFVCYPSLIEKLTQDKACLHSVELMKQTVLALKNTCILSSKITEILSSNHFKFRTEDYLHYRAADLQPVLLLPDVVEA